MKRGLTPLIVLLASATCFSACRTVRVVEQVPIHDTVRLTRVTRDSIYIDRWRTEYVDGDTVYVTNEVTKVVTKYVTDTAYRYVEKPVTVTRTVEVKKPLTWWQKTQQGGFWVLLAAVAVAIGVKILRKRHAW